MPVRSRQRVTRAGGKAERPGGKGQGLRGGPTGSDGWLVFEYVPVSLFSLKSSRATSAVGISLLVPTPYAVKMAFVDAAFRAGFPDSECARLLDSLVGVEVRISPPAHAVVNHTYVKIRQEPHSQRREPLRPYIPNVAYRELVFFRGRWRWAFDLRGLSDDVVRMLTACGPYINYVGRRGSFIQYVGTYCLDELGVEFTQPTNGTPGWVLPPRAHVVDLDDFGPEARFEVLNSYSPTSARAGRHRVFARTVVPLGLVRTGPGFGEYQA